MLRLTVLCSDDYHHKYLIARLSQRFKLELVVTEPAKQQRNRLLRRNKYRDFLFAEYHAFRRKLFGLSAYRRRYFQHRMPQEYLYPQIHVVSWINSPESQQLMRGIKSDVTIVMGTSILRRDTLALLGKTILNIHGGCLPFYRGNHCIFMAMRNSDFRRIASTIHFVDVNVDAGDIVEAIHPDMTPKDTPESLYCRAEFMAIERLVYWLGAIERRQELPRLHQDRDIGKTYRTRDRNVWDELNFWWLWITGRIRAPYFPSHTENAGGIGA